MKGKKNKGPQYANSSARLRDSDPATAAKLRLFEGSDVANSRGAAANPDGSIMRRSDAVGSTAPIDGQVRSQYGMSRREPAYQYGLSGRLAGAVAQRRR